MIPPALRVLHVLEATLGGTRRYLEDIAIATAGLPIEHGLAYGTSRADPGFANLLNLARAAGWYLLAVDAMRRPVRPFADARSALRVRQAIGQFKPSILHVHSAKAGAVGRIAAQSCWPNSPAVIYSPHALPIMMGAVYVAIERALVPLTKRFIAVSDSERREIVTQQITSAERVDVVYPRIDTEAYAPRDGRAARDRLQLGDVPIIIGIGRLAAQKDPLSFVEIVALVRRWHPQAVGIWVGDGELRPAVEESAARLKLGDGFRIAGWTTDVRPFIAASDLLLSTSRYESFGYVIPETFSMERPVVASRVTGTVDVFYPQAQKMLYSPDRLEDAAQLVKTLIEDKLLRAELGRLGRLSVIEKFSTSTMRAALASSYGAALK